MPLMTLGNLLAKTGFCAQSLYVLRFGFCIRSPAESVCEFTPILHDYSTGGGVLYIIYAASTLIASADTTAAVKKAVADGT